MKGSFFERSKNDVLKYFSTSLNGLSNEKVKYLQEQYGYNELPHKKNDGIFKILFKELREPIVLILIITIIISFLTHEYVDAWVIIFIVLVDLIMGVIQELKAQKNALALQELLKVKALVIRDNKEIEIDARELVLGDIVFLSSGNKISADLRLIETENLNVDESMLTGESIAVFKVSKILKKNNAISYNNMAYAGTSVISGRGIGVVVGVGVNTELGKITSVVNSTLETKSPLAIRMDRFTKQISLAILGVALVIFLILLSKGMALKEIFLIVVALAVSAMPEGLPLAKTMALTVGSNRMLKKNVLVKNLNAVESLGSCTVIATDKTGTLTKNEQTAKIIMLPNGEKFNISGIGYNDDGKINNINKKIKDLAFNVIINNEAIIEKNGDDWNYHGDFIDVAFLFMSLKANVIKDETVKILYEIPYESENKFSAVIYQKRGKCYCTAKGSLEKLLEFSSTMINKNNRKVKLDKDTVIKYNEEMAMNGYRVIAVASCEIELKKKYSAKDIQNLNLDALVGFIDPVRKESKQAVETCKKGGINVLMITGDHALTAKAIAKELKIIKSDKEIATKDDLDQFNDKTSVEFDEFIKTKKVFARVSSLDKYYIVESLKRQGEFVAVTGDGVNDAPALKAANIGVSMGSGTDVAQDTAKMILMDDNFLSIVEGIKEGRNAYNNIRKICYLLLSCGLAEVLFFVFSIVLNLPMPLIAIQLLWLNVVTDGIQDMALSFEEVTSDIMDEKPRSPEESIFNKLMLREILTSGIYISLIVLGLWIILVKKVGLDVNIARGYVMCLMVFIQNVHVLNCRSESKSIFVYHNKNKFVMFAIISCILLQFLVMEIPFLSSFLQTSSLPFKDISILFLISLSVLVLMEVNKFINKLK